MLTSFEHKLCYSTRELNLAAGSGCALYAWWKEVILNYNSNFLYLTFITIRVMLLIGNRDVTKMTHPLTFRGHSGYLNAFFTSISLGVVLLIRLTLLCKRQWGDGEVL